MHDGYEIGYGKPPKHGQFKKGRSGNPKGRPKGARNLKTELEEELAEPILVKEAGKPRKVSKQRAVIKSLLAKALGGDARAAGVLINMIVRLLADVGEAEAGQDISADDQAILQRFRAQVLREVAKTEEGNDDRHQ